WKAGRYCTHRCADTSRMGGLAPDDLVEAFAAAGHILSHDKREIVLIEQLEPFVPFDKFIAAGILRPIRPIHVFISLLVEDDSQDRLCSGFGRGIDDRWSTHARRCPVTDRFVIGKGDGFGHFGPPSMMSRYATSGFPHRC